MCKKTMVKEGEEAARVTFYDGEGSTIQSLQYTVLITEKRHVKVNGRNRRRYVRLSSGMSFNNVDNREGVVALQILLPNSCIGYLITFDICKLP